MSAFHFKNLLLGVLLVPTLLAQDPASETHRSNLHTITVSGSGEASAPPDQAIVRLGASAQTAEAGAAQSKVNEIMQKALDAIEKTGVPRKSIHTATLTLSSVYANERVSVPNEGPRVVGFRANNTIEVVLDDPKLVGKVIDAGISVGANELQGVSFTLKNDTTQRANALSAAAQEARAKARTIAGSLDLKLGNIIEVNEGGVHVVPLNEGFGGGRMMMMKSAASASTPVEPGEVRIQANVTVRYEIAH